MTRFFSVRLLFVCVALLLTTACDLFIDDEGRIARAEAAAAESDYRTAVIDLKNVLRETPDNVRARVLLGEMLVIQGDPASAIKELSVARERGATADDYMVPLAEALLRQAKFAEVVALNPQEIFDTGKQAHLFALMGRAELGRGNSATARRRFDEALELDPDQRIALVGIARISSAQGDLAGASEVLELAMRSGEADHATLAALGQLKFDQKKYAEAEESFEAALNAATAPGLRLERMSYLQAIIESQLALDDKPAARATARKMLQMTNDHPLALLHAARVDMLSNDPDAVIDKAQRVIAIYPDLEPARLLLAGAEMAKNNFSKAGSHLQAVVNANPTNDEARKLLAQVRIQQGSPEQALEVLEPMLASSGADPQLLAMVGTATIRGGNSERGVEYLERGIEAAGDDPAILQQAAANFLAAGEINRAIEILESIPPGEQVERADMLLVLALLRKNDNEGARKKVNTLVEERPNDPSAYEVKGAFHVAIKEIEQARKDFEQAHELAPDRVAPVINLARLDAEGGDTEAAEQRLQDFLKQKPGDATVLVTLSQLAERRGDNTTALSWMEQAREANPEAAGPALVLGNYYLRSGQLELAAERAKQAVRIAPGNGNAHVLEGRILMQSNRASEALQTFERAVEVAPNLADAHLNLGRVYELQGATDAALASYQRALELQPKMFPARAALAGIAVRRGDLGSAITVIDGLIEDYPDRAEPHILRGDIELSRGNLKAALLQYETAFDLQPSGLLVFKRAETRRRMGDKDAVLLYEDWIAGHPNDIQTRMRLGRVHLSERRVDDAIEQFEEVMKIQPGSAPARYLAQSYEARGDLDKTVEWLDKAIELEPGSLELKVARVRLQMKRGDVKDAKSAIRKLRRDYPESASVLELDGDILSSDKDHAAAASSYERAIRLEPSSVLTAKHFNARHQLGDREAAKLLVNWLNENPDDTQVAMVLAQHYQDMGRDDDAVVTYRRLLDSNPTDAIVWNNLAWLYLQRNNEGDMSRAVTAAERAYNNRNIPAIADTYGWILLQSGDVGRATEILEKAAAGMPAAEVRYHYAVALHQSGRDDEARKLLTQVLDSGEEFSDRNKAEKLHRELGG